MNNNFSYFSIISILLTFFSVKLSYAQNLPEFFSTEVDITPCPEYWEGNVAIDIFYRIGNLPDIYPAEVESVSIDKNTSTYSPIIKLPSFHGTTPLSVISFCRSASEFSRESNSKQISNCDNLSNYDSDGDGLTNNLEDTNCDNFFSPGDASNPFNVDTDGNGVRDLVEIFSGTDPSNPSSSPRPVVFSGSVFDFEGNDISNPVVWRPQTGTWYIRSNINDNLNSAIQFGLNGDIPFTYRDDTSKSDVGVIRMINNTYVWFFRGKGFTTTDGENHNSLTFGIFGDNIILGPWEHPDITSPAVARLFNGVWTFDILLSDGSIKSQTWGGNGDIPKPQDFDGDGIFDLAVYRPGNQTTYIIPSDSPDKALIIPFGSGTAEHTVRGDYSGDGKEDISFWEPRDGLFSTLTSTNGFDSEKALEKDPDHYQELELGEYEKDLPLSWTFDGEIHIYTIINHNTGIRKFYPENNPDFNLQEIQWGLPGDSQG